LALSVPRPAYQPMPAKAPLAVGDTETLAGAEAYAVRLRAAQN
jgi:hypothetical protein